MSDAPERIWTTSGGDAGSWTTTQSRMAVHMPDGWQVEYVRADLVPQWQPIETAPKDGSEFLCWSKGWRYPHMAYWESEYMSFENPFTYDFMDQPTHWMPLPAPPTEGDA